MSDPYAKVKLSTKRKGQKMTKTYYLSDTYDNNQAWVFATLDEAQAVMESMQIADSNQYPDEMHDYVITETSPFK
jgi:hypothetical protein